MLPELQKMTPEQRLADGRCPECAVKLDGRDTLAERDHHWPKHPEDRPEHAEARKRYAMLTELAAAQAQAAALAAAAEKAKRS